MKSKLYWFQEFKAVSRQNIASSFNSGFCTAGFIFRDSGMVRRQPESAVLYCSLSRLSNTPTESHCFWLNDVVNHEPVTIKKKKLPFTWPSLLHLSWAGNNEALCPESMWASMCSVTPSKELLNLRKHPGGLRRSVSSYKKMKHRLLPAPQSSRLIWPLRCFGIAFWDQPRPQSKHYHCPEFKHFTLMAFNCWSQEMETVYFCFAN